jgi:hypothetical protein
MYQIVGSEMSTKRMGGMGKLSDFGKTPVVSPVINEPVNEVAPASTEAVATNTEVVAKKVANKTKKVTQEKLVTVNIKIKRSQQEWLADTAQSVRSNNTEPVSPSDRVFPQHLIGVAIELLKNADVDWEKVKTLTELKDFLKL